MTVPCILFQVAGTVYALPADSVRVVDMIEAITRVPNAAAWIDGLVTVRGQVVPVVNMRRWFGFEHRPYDMESRLIVVDVQGRLLGLAVDQAREFLRLSMDDVESPPEALKGVGREALEGIVNRDGRLILLLNAARLFAEEDVAVTR